MADSRARSPSVGADDDTYRVRAQAFLLTYKGMVYPDQFLCMEVWARVEQYSLCHERGGITHTHAYIVLRETPDILVTKFEVDGLPLPNVQPCRGRGRSAHRARDRGHFYVFCRYKTTHLFSQANYRPVRDYAVDTTWVRDLWQQGKVDNAIECAAEYRCLTPQFEAMVNRCRAQLGQAGRRQYLADRERQLAKVVRPFRILEEIEHWKQQYKGVRMRYHFLWLYGPTQMGKTQLAKSLGSNPCVHSAGVTWSDYNPVVHDVIIFDDIFDTERYILHHKAMFQASGVVTVNTSKTNCHATFVDTTDKKIVVCNNNPPMDAWIIGNCVVARITEPVWVDQFAIQDQCSITERWTTDGNSERL